MKCVRKMDLSSLSRRAAGRCAVCHVLAVLVAVAFTAVFPAWAGEIIDRTVARVNRSAILQSDLELQLRYEAFLERRPLSKLTEADAEATLNRLIDQELLRGEMKLTGFRLREERVSQRIQEIRKAYPGADTDQGWRAVLAEYGLSEPEFHDRVVAQLEILRFVDTRLRPNVHIERSAIEEYYRQKFLPELKRAGGKDVPLEQVSEKIEEVLVQQHMDELLTEWLNNLRQQSSIHTELPVYGPMSASGVRPSGGGRGKYRVSGMR
ncbi:MAG: SurA N-terminal domain-containing protein [Terriglobales bacterium]